MRRLLVFFNLRMLTVLVTGFSSGLPLALTASTMQAWLVSEKVDLATIGLFSLVGIPYSLKFLWAPFLDLYLPPFFKGKENRRRGWILISQFILFITILILAFCSPSTEPSFFAFMTFLLAFFSASQDIVIDALRVEILDPKELGAGASYNIFAYRLAMLFSGAFALFLADRMSWKYVYMIMAFGQLACSAYTFWVPLKTVRKTERPRSLNEAVVTPLAEFFKRRGAIEILIFILLYKLDVMLTLAMNTPFLLDIGFSKTDIAAVTKVFGMVATILGGLVAGFFMTKMTMFQSLFNFGLIQALSSLSFLSLAHFGKVYWLLTMTVFFENFCSGLGNTAFAAFMMSQTNTKYTATQYALLGSFMALSRYIVGAPSGFLAQSFGWEGYFIICALIGVPGLLLLIFRYKKWALLSNS